MVEQGERWVPEVVELETLADLFPRIENHPCRFTFPSGEQKLGIPWGVLPGRGMIVMGADCGVFTLVEGAECSVEIVDVSELEGEER